MSTHGNLVHSADLQVLPTVEWKAAARAHRERLDRLVGPYLERRAAGTTHPVVDFLFTYDRAVEVADAHAVADLFTSYGAYLPDGDSPAFGSDIQQRYQSIFDSGCPFLGHELHEVASVDGVTFAVAVTRSLRSVVKTGDCGRNLFVLTNIEGQWKIAAFAPGAPTTRTSS